MYRKEHIQEQIVAALQQAQGDEKVAEVCRKLSISQATFCTWKKRILGSA